ncbi:MAG: hypothetical protein HYY04_00870 [Chloroflexi bacterium]|nr:hypothetical protein [Chloroflexota bacterium]
MPEAAICFDTSVLRYFSQAGAMGILEARYRGRACTSEETRAELAYQRDHGVVGLDAALEALDRWISCLVIDDPTEVAEFTRLKAFFSRQPHLGRGEAAAIVLARRLGAIVAVDERSARTHAARAGLQVVGVIGILRAMAADGDLTWSQAEGIFARMVASGFRAPAVTLRASLEKLAGRD